MAQFRPIEISQFETKAPADPGAAPMLEWLKIADLVVDESYQRQLQRSNWSAIKRIAAQFSWSRFSPVFVAPVEGGKYAIIDGQHRTHAAAICDFQKVPCQIVPMNRAEQAASFAAVNGLVTKVTPLQIYRAALVSRAKWALQLDQAARSADCEVMTCNSSAALREPKQIFSVITMRKLIAEHGFERITAALKVFAAADNVAAQSELWGNLYLRSSLTALAERPDYLARADAVRHFGLLDFWAITDKADDRRRAALRAGVPALPKHEMIYTYILDHIDALLSGGGKAELPKPSALISASPKPAVPVSPVVPRPSNPQAAIMHLMRDRQARNEGKPFALQIGAIATLTGIPIAGLPYQLSVLTASGALIKTGTQGAPVWQVAS